MKYGIYYAYWEKEWGGNFVPYTEKCARLGFDILEVACGAFDREDDRFFRELAAAAKANGLRLTGGYGPRKGHDLAGTDPAQVEAAFRFYADMFRKMELAGIDRLGGALYSYWPAQCTPETDKAADTDRSVARMQRLADLAADHGITLCMEALNRFEGYMINTADECLAYVRAVNRPNVKVMLDTFHMNIEEDSLTDAIRKSGPLLGHFHVGEANRRCPGPNGRFDWAAIGRALRSIGYAGGVVMEPFVRMGGQVSRDVSLWRDLSGGASNEQLDQDAATSLTWLRSVMEGKDTP
ncbi:MAG: sugar phosphate isomerase/epimerase family protein [Clostridiales bacterium]|nr:sugar phosphate isomerase/epimerase [Flavonifractor sp.]MDU2195637.1 sugar phosphate isomerase/epimerase family protein [Clostridiales bacterium]